MSKASYTICRRFVPGPVGDLFLTEYIPEGRAIAHVLLVPPFAEELNRARRMLFLQARSLAEHGVQVCQPDLSGTGDSDGDFGKTDWETWIRDLQAASAAVSGKPPENFIILGLRLGALLATDAVRQGALQVSRLCFWSPCVNGELYMTQFLRLRRMAGVLARSTAQESIAELRTILHSGMPLEVAGYELSPKLVAAVDVLKMTDCMDSSTPPVDWIEVVADDSRPLSPNVSRTVGELGHKGATVQTLVVQAPPFWSTTEIAVSDDVLDATTRVIVRSRAP